MKVTATRHREVRVEIDLAALAAVPVGDGADHDRGVEHVVVEREVVRRNVVDSEVALSAPALRAQLGRVSLQLAG